MLKASENPSIVEWFAEHEGYRCGYCKSKDTTYSHGMWAHTMTTEDYQNLIDRGWRRSGKYLYKPTMNQTCCPQYTIKCDIVDFKMNKSHKKVIKHVNKFLITGERPHKGDTTQGEATGENIGVKGSGDMDNKPQGTKRPPRPGVGADPNKVPCKKAKDIRREKKLQKLQQANSVPQHVTKPSTPQPKSLEELLGEPAKAENPKHKLEVRLVQTAPQSDVCIATLDETHTLFRAYQMAVHGEPEDECEMQHYTRFLVDSPLKARESGDMPHGYGSFHQHYVLDGQLIAVGVLDILPHCVSSVYLFYNPEYDFLSLGTYSALQEIAFVRSLHQSLPEIRYYYMGFYLHECPKMKYKGQYHGSSLLCPETYTWHSIDKCQPILDHTKYSRFEDDINKGDADKVTNLNDVMVLHDRTMMPYSIYRRKKRDADDEEEVKQYAGFVGRKCVQSMLLFRS